MVDRQSGFVKEEITVREFAGVFVRQRWLIAAIFFLALLLAAASIITSPTLYGASVKLVVKAPPLSVSSSQAQNDPIQAVMVRDIAPELQDQVQLVGSPEVLSKAFTAVGIAMPRSQEELSNLVAVHQVGLSSVLEVVVSLPSQLEATQIVEAIPNILRDELKRPAQDNLKEGIDFLEKRLKDETELLSQARKDLTSFELKSPLLNSEGVLQEAQNRLAQARAQLQLADAAVDSDEKRLRALQATRRSTPRQVDQSSSDTNQRTEDIKHELTTLEAQRAEALATYLPTSPEVKAIDAKIQVESSYLAAIPRQLARKTLVANPQFVQLDQTIAIAEGDLAGAKAQRAQDQKFLDDALVHLNEVSKANPIRQSLVTKISSIQQSTQTLQSKIDDLKARRTTVTEPVELLASEDLGKVSPKISYILSLALFMALLLSIPAALIKEKIDDKVVSGDDIDELFGAPVIGTVPSSSSNALESRFGRTAALERYRALRFNIDVDPIHSPVETLLVVSAGASEARAQVSFNLASEAAIDGRTVILVDTNIRNSTMLRIAKLGEGMGLSDYLTGQAGIELVSRLVSERFSIISAGSRSDNPTDLIASPRFSELIAELRNKYDLVIIDGVPATLAADARLAARCADGVLVVAQENVTKRRLLRFTVEMFKRSGARIIGIVFNDTSRKRASNLASDI